MSLLYPACIGLKQNTKTGTLYAINVFLNTCSSILQDNTLRKLSLPQHIQAVTCSKSPPLIQVSHLCLLAFPDKDLNIEITSLICV